ncbi:MAG: AAA family ATPase [Gemmatimonadetes bacterium]|nr:AAA family ATPase [Gemmatimonadota bacterium]
MRAADPRAGRASGSREPPGSVTGDATEILRLIDGLQRPEAYPHPADELEVQQTHISVVFLAGAYAYKVKKPVELGFLDFTTLEKRLHFCREEIRLNRRLAAGVYLGVVPITERNGRIEVGGHGRVLDYAVMMERLPPHATLRERLRRGEVDEAAIGTLARRIARFHAGADGGPAVARYGRWEVVARNARENFVQSRRHVGATISAAVFRRLEALTEAHLDRLRPVIERRAREGLPRDTHGDLHLEHVYWFPDREPPRDFLILDCIEFNERFRYADPVADIAFLFMDLASHGRRDLAGRLGDTYFEAANDPEGRSLLPFYVAYRAAVRGKVEGMTASEEEVPAPERERAIRAARAHWLLALGELEAPERRPCLVLAAGLPGTGKSTLARLLAERASFRIVSSDETRKQLAGIGAGTPAHAPFGEGLYTEEWNARTYRECLARAERHLFEGERAIVDASFHDEAKRRLFLETAAAWGVPALMLVSTAPTEIVRERMHVRAPSASDADWSIYQRVAERWESPSPATARRMREVPAGGTPDSALDAALDHLRAVRLAQ